MNAQFVRVAAVHLVLIVRLRRMAGLVKLQCSFDLVSERQQWAGRVERDHLAVVRHPELSGRPGEVSLAGLPGGRYLIYLVIEAARVDP